MRGLENQGIDTLHIPVWRFKIHCYFTKRSFLLKLSIEKSHWAKRKHKFSSEKTKLQIL